MSPQVLLVEPDLERRIVLSTLLAPVAHVRSAVDFITARRSLSMTRYDLLVSNIRLGDHNGLHLVYHAHATDTRSVIYAEDDYLYFARLARAAGAFCERCGRAPIALPGYLAGALPPSDRRDPAVVDRRFAPVFRGGRRCADRGE